MMPEKVIWDLETIRDEVVNVLRVALSTYMLSPNVKMKKVYLEGDNIVAEGRYEIYDEEGEYKVVLRSDNLKLVSYEVS